MVFEMVYLLLRTVFEITRIIRGTQIPMGGPYITRLPFVYIVLNEARVDLFKDARVASCTNGRHFGFIIYVLDYTRNLLHLVHV